jgi:hypothetical protein
MRSRAGMEVCQPPWTTECWLTGFFNALLVVFRARAVHILELFLERQSQPERCLLAGADLILCPLVNGSLRDDVVVSYHPMARTR